MAKYKVYICDSPYYCELHALTCEAKSEAGARRIANDYIRRWDLHETIRKIVKV